MKGFGETQEQKREGKIIAILFYGFLVWVVAITIIVLLLIGWW